MLPEVNRKYDAAGEADLYIRMLDEYSDKIEELRKDFEECQRRASLWAVALFLTGAALSVLAPFTLRDVSPLWWSLFAFSLAGVVLSVSKHIAGERDKAKRLERGMLKTANRLEGFVRTVSQLEEHGDLDKAKRLELDMRLNEAEVLLKYVSKA